MLELNYGNRTVKEIGDCKLELERIRFADIAQNDIIMHYWLDGENAQYWVGKATVKGQVAGWFGCEQSHYSESSNQGWVEPNFQQHNSATVAYDWHDEETNHALFRVLSGWDKF